MKVPHRHQAVPLRLPTGQQALEHGHQLLAFQFRMQRVDLVEIRAVGHPQDVFRHVSYRDLVHADELVQRRQCGRVLRRADHCAGRVHRQEGPAATRV